MLSLRLTNEEFSRIHVHATNAELDMSDWIRSQLFGPSHEPPSPPSVLDWQSAGIYLVTPNPLPVGKLEILKRYVCEVLRPSQAATVGQETGDG